MKIDARTRLRLVLAVPLAAAVVRIVQALRGSVAEMQAASEIAVGFAVVGTLGATLLLWGSARRRARIIQGLAIALWGALIVIPTWRLGHQPVPLYDDWIGGNSRQVKLVPSDSGRFRLTVRHGDKPNHRAWILSVSVGGSTYRMQGIADSESTARAIRLTKGDALTVTLERGEGVRIEIIRPPPPRGLMLAGAAFALLLLMAAEISFSRMRRGLRGLSTWIAATSFIFLAGLDPGTTPTGKAAIGMAALALCGGGIVAAIWAAILNRRQRTSRKR